MRRPPPGSSRPASLARLDMSARCLKCVCSGTLARFCWGFGARHRVRQSVRLAGAHKVSIGAQGVPCVSLEGYHVLSLADTDSALGCLTSAGGVVTLNRPGFSGGPNR